MNQEDTVAYNGVVYVYDTLKVEVDMSCKIVEQ